ncbi:hypothetical protein Pelo_17838 [Pelomyxa schiedti]|nr:hypothetical protein Pelo_17838 [Pelomyxa schiedti]
MRKHRDSSAHAIIGAVFAANLNLNWAVSSCHIGHTIDVVCSLIRLNTNHSQMSVNPHMNSALQQHNNRDKTKFQLPLMHATSVENGHLSAGNIFKVPH